MNKLIVLLVLVCTGCQSVPCDDRPAPKREAEVSIEAPPGEIKKTKVVIKMTATF